MATRFLFLATAFSLVSAQVNSAEGDICTFSRHLGLGGGQLALDEWLPNWPTDPSRSHVFQTNHLIMESTALLFQRLKNGTQDELAQTFQFEPIEQVATIELNQNCRWSDGEPIISQNYIDAFKMIFDPENEAYNPGRDFFENGKQVWAGELPFEELGIKAIDEFTLQFDMTIPESLFKAVMSYASFTPAPSHILKDKPDYWAKYHEANVVSGPYMHVANDDEKITLEPNPYYCDRSSQNFDQITIYKTDGEVEIGNLVVEKKIDIVGRLPARQLEVFSANSKIQNSYDILDVNDEVLYFFAPMVDHIESKEVREALGSVLDFSYLESNTVGYFLGLADSFAFRYSGYNPPQINVNLEAYESRIAHARSVLEENGYTDENPLHLTFKIGDSEIYRYLGQLITSMLSQIPVTAEAIESTYKAGEETVETNIMLNAWGSDYADPENFLTFFASTFGSKEKKPIMLELLKQANSASTPEERFALLAEVEVHMDEDKSVFPISWFKTPWLVAKKFEKQQGFYFLGRNFMRTDCLPKHKM